MRCSPTYTAPCSMRVTRAFRCTSTPSPSRSFSARAARSGSNAVSSRRPALDQQDLRVARIEVAEVVEHRVVRDVRENARELDARGPAAHDHEAQPRFTIVLRGLLRLLERAQKAMTNLERVLEALEPGRHWLPLVVPEVRVARARRDDEIVVRHLDLPEVRLHDAALDVDAVDLRHQHRRVRVLAQQPPNRRRDVARRQHGRRHLIEQRLEEMVVRAVEQRDVDVRRCCSPRAASEPREAAADDHDARSRHAVGIVSTRSARPPNRRAATVMSSTSRMSSTLYAAAVPNDRLRSCARISIEIGLFACV